MTRQNIFTSGAYKAASLGVAFSPEKATLRHCWQYGLEVKML